MRYAIVKDNVCVNIAISESPLGEDWIASETAKIGDTHKNGKFTTPKAKAIAPENKSPIQKLGELLVSKNILTASDIENL